MRGMEMPMTASAVRAPATWLLLAEGRALVEFGAMVASLPWLRTLPKGDGHAVMVLPGLVASDTSTEALRRFLIDRGYDARPWGQGRNLGLRPGLLDGMLGRVQEIYSDSGGKVSLVGWSLGGIFARELAKLAPEQVRQVISLGSPFAGSPRASHAWRVYEYAAGHSVDEPPIKTDLAAPPPVPTTSIYSRSDGVVAWQCCINPDLPHTDNIEVEGSHCGLGHNPVVLAAIADRLAQAERDWQKFDRSSLARRFVYRDPERAGCR